MNDKQISAYCDDVKTTALKLFYKVQNQRKEISMLHKKCALQKAEIERLEEVHKSLEEAYREQENYEDMIIKGAEVCARCHEEYAEKIKQAKAEAVKEVIARVKEYFNPDTSFEFRKWLEDLEKILVGEDKTPSAENNFLYNRFMKKE